VPYNLQSKNQIKLAMRSKMPVQYSPVSNARRHELIRLIHEENVTIRQAAIK